MNVIKHSSVGGCRTQRGALVLDEPGNNAVVTEEGCDRERRIPVGIDGVLVRV